jgi:serine/threonine protein kinase
MGEVYRARDTRLQRTIAIKVIPATMRDPETMRRLEAEALSASALNHPNILTVHEFGVQDGVQYLATEFVEGQTLRDRLREGRFTIAGALDVILQTASALGAAHAAGLVHRDVKPENVMLRPDGFVKVVDFGLAKLTPLASAAPDLSTVSLQTLPGTILGTVGYMAPEQLRGLPVDHRADIWSVGVILHEMIAGRSPFAERTTSDVIASVLDREAPSLAGSGVNATPELERIIQKALAKERDERYQTIKDFSIDVGRLKRQLDVDAELQRSRSQGAEADTQPRTWYRRSISLLAAVIVVSVAAALFMAWTRGPAAGSSPPPAATAALPLHTVEYWLTVQKMRAGEPYQDPFEASGREIFESGYRFRFNFQSPEPGFLYLINQGPGPGGEPTLHVLFPTPGIREGTSAVRGSEPVQTGWNRFDQNPGTERFWVVWSVLEMPELEHAKRWANAEDFGHIKDGQEARAIQQLLVTHAPSVQREYKDTATHRTVIEGHGNVLARLTELEHR